MDGFTLFKEWSVCPQFKNMSPHIYTSVEVTTPRIPYISACREVKLIMVTKNIQTKGNILIPIQGGWWLSEYWRD